MLDPIPVLIASWSYIFKILHYIEKLITDKKTKEEEETDATQFEFIQIEEATQQPKYTMKAESLVYQFRGGPCHVTQGDLIVYMHNLLKWKKLAHA